MEELEYTSLKFVIIYCKLFALPIKVMFSQIGYIYCENKVAENRKNSTLTNDKQAK